MASGDFKLDIHIPFPSEREAEIAYHVLRVDKEPPRSQVTKTLTLNNKTLDVSFTAPGARQLRVGVNGFLDYLMLVCETVEAFGPPVSNEYSYFDAK